MQPFNSGISLIGTVQSQQLADVVRSTANRNIKSVLVLWCNEVNLNTQKIWLSESYFTIAFRLLVHHLHQPSPPLLAPAADQIQP